MFLHKITQKIKNYLPGPALGRSSIGEELWIFGMTAPADQKFFSDASAALKNAPGEIIDLGCWMGSTSISLAKGFEGATIRNHVKAYDLFRWESWMDRNLAHTYCDYLPGETFLPEVRRRLKEFSDRIVLIQADLCSYAYDESPIKILLVDAMKSKKLSESICRNFYPCLLPGALVIHQDFKHYCTPWIHILHFRLREFFTLYHVVKNGDTAAFELTVPIPLETLVKCSDLSKIDDSEVEEAFSHSLGLLEGIGLAPVAAAHVMHYVHRNEMQKAEQIFRRYQKQCVFSEAELNDLAPHISSFLSVA
jgi:hypothetical protein